MVPKCLKVFLQVFAYWRSMVIVMVPIALLPLALHGSKESRCGYVVGVMALYWMTEALPLAVTSLLPVVLFPLLGVLSTEQICVSYFKEPNMMFVGGLIVAIAVEHCNLHKRVAIRIVLMIGTSRQRLLIGIMATTMLLSMWISNTATTAMMVPIVTAVLDELKTHEKDSRSRKISGSEARSQHDSGTFDQETRRKSVAVHRFELGVDEEKQQAIDGDVVCYFLGVAYAANIGGTGTLTGTGTNLAFRGLFEEIFHTAEGINFASWMAFNVPLMLINTTLAGLWLYFVFVSDFMIGNLFLALFRQSFHTWNWSGFFTCKKRKDFDKELQKERSIRELMKKNYKKLGPMTFHEYAVLCVFLLCVFLWFFRKPEFMPGWGSIYSDVVIDDATAAILAVVLLFILPANLDFLKCGSNRKSVPSLLNWKIVHEKVPWGLVLLSGGGFAMAAATKESGLSRFLGQQLTAIKVLDPFVMLIVVCLATTFVTEVSSNTAIANIVLPVLAEMSIAIHRNPLFLMLPATLCCSYAFMLPVATPPNAIVVAASNMRPTQMMKAGLGMNFICVFTLIACLETFGIHLYDLDKFPHFGIEYMKAHNITIPPHLVAMSADP